MGPGTGIDRGDAQLASLGVYVGMMKGEVTINECNGAEQVYMYANNFHFVMWLFLSWALKINTTSINVYMQVLFLFHREKGGGSSSSHS